ncbi:acyl-CoA dehydrogenase family protein [Microbacterium jiangjiandongii]|uniref:acyl-CoA dehydrogenase family protein n=1 Tax=Microbacterium jiangjiandongii TaxID=3049071 RepID=UPI00214CD6C4|nr:acyl-CoA dehydrogenase family protein [Microbacterium sp. zg.Y843]MCR2815363.1 acyl-CoA dehydrogenase family protein [Microbacterium sp. zg.Y843]
MNVTLSGEAQEVGAMVRDRVEREGGVDLLRGAVADPGRRDRIGEMLGELGIWDIDPAEGATELEVAAEVCRVAGRFALPYPVVERLGRSGADATALVSRRGNRVVPHLDLALSWNGIDLEGARHRLQPRGSGLVLGTQLAPFGVEADAAPEEGDGRRAAALLISLESWWLLGLLESAVEDTARYTREREQFGRPLAHFQSVAFQLADMSLEAVASAELAKYTLWVLACGADADEALIEALGLRVALQRAAGCVLRGAHQLHGAMGFTDEVDVSWLSRASQAARRLPEDAHRTTGVLLEMLERVGYPQLGRTARRTP